MEEKKIFTDHEVFEQIKDARAVAMGHKTYQCTTDFENFGDYFCFWANYFMNHFC
jgi:hypothetical protein